MKMQIWLHAARAHCRILFEKESGELIVQPICRLSLSVVKLCRHALIPVTSLGDVDGFDKVSLGPCAGGDEDVRLTVFHFLGNSDLNTL